MMKAFAGASLLMGLVLAGSLSASPVSTPSTQGAPAAVARTSHPTRAGSKSVPNFKNKKVHSPYARAAAADAQARAAAGGHTAAAAHGPTMVQGQGVPSRKRGSRPH